MVGCSRCTYPSIHLFVSKSRSVVRGAVVCCVCMRVLCCVVCCVVCVWCVVLVLVLVFGGGVVWCGVYFVSFCVVFSLFSLNFILSLSCSLSLFLSSLFFPLFSLLSSLPLFLLSSLLATKHYGKNRSTNTPANIEAFVIWRRASAQQSVLSLLLSPPLPSLPPPPSSKKKEETFYYRNISGEGIILHYSFILIQKNRRRVKLQSLQFYTNSKTIKLQRVKSVIILAAMVLVGAR